MSQDSNRKIVHTDESTEVAVSVVDNVTHILIHSKKTEGLGLAVSVLGTGFMITGTSGQFIGFKGDDGGHGICFAPVKK